LFLIIIYFLFFKKKKKTNNNSEKGDGFAASGVVRVTQSDDDSVDVALRNVVVTKEGLERAMFIGHVHKNSN